MFKPVQKNWLVVLSISLMLCVPYVGTGQNATKQAARAAKVSPDLLNVFLKQTVEAALPGKPHHPTRL